MTTSREKNPPPPTDVRSETSRLSQAARERIFIDGDLFFPVSHVGPTINDHAHDGIFIEEDLTWDTEHGLGVEGTFQKHRFCAIVNLDHASDPCFELGTSGIEHLEVWRFGDSATVAVFDRGWRMKPRTKAAEQVVDALAASLATRLLPVFAYIVDSSADNQRHEERGVTQEPCPFCKETMASIDTHCGITNIVSQTLKCETCEECFLHVRHYSASAIIHLPFFLKRRGEAPEQRPLHDWTMAENVVMAMDFDKWPSAAACVDFGLSTPNHYAAMQQAMRKGLTSYELDRVLGNGKAITELVSFTQHGEHTPTIKFSTPYDELRNETTPAAQSPVHQKRKSKLTLGF